MWCHSFTLYWRHPRQIVTFILSWCLVTALSIVCTFSKIKHFWNLSSQTALFTPLISALIIFMRCKLLWNGNQWISHIGWECISVFCLVGCKIFILKFLCCNKKWKSESQTESLLVKFWSSRYQVIDNNKLDQTSLRL